MWGGMQWTDLLGMHPSLGHVSHLPSKPGLLHLQKGEMQPTGKECQD